MLGMTFNIATVGSGNANVRHPRVMNIIIRHQLVPRALSISQDPAHLAISYHWVEPKLYYEVKGRLCSNG